MTAREVMEYGKRKKDIDGGTAPYNIVKPHDIVPMKKLMQKRTTQDRNKSKDWCKKHMIGITSFIITLFMVGLGCLALPVRFSWISGILFLLVGFVWGYLFWLFRINGTGTMDRELSRGMWSQLSLLFGAVAIAFLVGVGALLLFHHDFDNQYDVCTGYDAFIYIAHRYLGYNFYDDGNITNTFIFVFSLIGTVLVGGLLITTLSNIVQQRKEDIDHGVVGFKLEGHTVIIGFGDYAIHIAKNSLMDEGSIVALMTNQNMLRVRSRLRVELPDSSMDRLFLISGEMTTEADINKLSLPEAKDVYVLGEEKEFGVDSKCIECVKYISKARGDRAAVLPVYVHLQHLYSNKYIKSADKPSPVKDANNIFFRPFCFYENWGRLLWGHYALPQYSPLDYKPIEEDTHVHLVVVGLNRMGAALVLQAARICHYPNFNENKNKTVISVIERDPNIVEEFKSIYPGLMQLEDVSVVFEQKTDGKYHSFESFSGEIDKYARDPKTLLTIAICYRDPDEAISAALRLPESVFYQKGMLDVVKVSEQKVNEKVIVSKYEPAPDGNHMQTQVLIRQEVNNGLGQILDEDEMHYKNYHVFGMFEEGLNFELLDDTLPMLARDNYTKMEDGSFLQEYQKLMEKSEPVFDYKKWHEAPEWDRMSNRCQIDMLKTYLNVLCSEGLLHKKGDNPEDWDIESYVNSDYYRLVDGEERKDGVPPYDEELAIKIAEIEHRRWNAERKIAGWRAPDSKGERLDAFYIHPFIVPFKDLDRKTQYKDIIVLRAAPLLEAIRIKCKKNKIDITES